MTTKEWIAEQIAKREEHGLGRVCTEPSVYDLIASVLDSHAPESEAA